MWLENLLTTNFTKNMSDLICTCDMYLVLYIEHNLQPASPCVLKSLSSRCPTLFGETCGSQFKGYCRKEWCVSWAMIWSRHIASCALWALPCGKSCIWSPPKKNSLKTYYTSMTLPLGPCLFLPNHLFCLSHRKTRWTMSVNYVSLKTCLLGTSTFMVTLIFFSLV